MVGFTEPNRYEPRAGWRETLAQWMDSPPDETSWQNLVSVYWRRRTVDGLSVREAWKELEMEPETARAALHPASADSGLIPPELVGRVLMRSRANDVNPSDAEAEVKIAETPAGELPDKPEVGYTPPRDNPRRPALYQPRAGWRTKLLLNPPPNAANWFAQLHIYWRRRTEQHKLMEEAWSELNFDRTDAGTSLERNLADRGSIPPELIGRVLARSRGNTKPEDTVDGILLYPDPTV